MKSNCTEVINNVDIQLTEAKFQGTSSGIKTKLTETYILIDYKRAALVIVNLWRASKYQAEHVPIHYKPLRSSNPELLDI